MRWNSVNKSFFSSPLTNLFLVVYVFGIVISFLIFISLGESALKSLFVIGVVSLLLVPIYLIVKFKDILKDPVRIGFDIDKIILIYRKRTVEIPYEDVTSISTWGKTENLTTITQADNKVISLGYGTAGDFALSLCEAFKTYMEEKGLGIKVEKTNIKSIFKDDFYQYTLMNSVEDS